MCIWCIVLWQHNASQNKSDRTAYKRCTSHTEELCSLVVELVFFHVPFPKTEPKGWSKVKEKSWEFAPCTNTRQCRFASILSLYNEPGCSRICSVHCIYIVRKGGRCKNCYSSYQHTKPLCYTSFQILMFIAPFSSRSFASPVIHVQCIFSSFHTP